MKNNRPEDDLDLIKDLMEKSTKFSNLSGIAIFSTGILAIIGASFVYFDIGFSISEINISYFELINQNGESEDIFLKLKLLILIASLILISSLFIMYIAARKKSNIEGIPLFNSSFSRTLKSLFVPLISGGVFCLLLINNNMYGLVAPATLIFYGLGLVSSSKFSYNELEFLGYLELLLGFVASLYIGSGLLFWIIGFGVCHIFFGLLVHFKYDKK